MRNEKQNGEESGLISQRAGTLKEGLSCPGTSEGQKGANPGTPFRSWNVHKGRTEGSEQSESHTSVRTKMGITGVQQAYSERQDGGEGGSRQMAFNHIALAGGEENVKTSLT